MVTQGQGTMGKYIHLGERGDILTSTSQRDLSGKELEKLLLKSNPKIRNYNVTSVILSTLLW